MSLRAKPKASPLQSAFGGASRLQHVINVGNALRSTVNDVPSVGAVIPRFSAYIPSEQQFELSVYEHVVDAMKRTQKEIMTDLDALPSTKGGYLENEIRVNLSAGGNVQDFGDVLAKLIMTQTANQQYTITVQAVVDSPAFGLASQNWTTEFNFNKYSVALEELYVIFDANAEETVMKKLALDYLSAHPYVKNLLEAVHGVDVVKELSGEDIRRRSDWIGSFEEYMFEGAEYYARQGRGWTPNTRTKAYFYAGVLIEVKKAYLMALLALAYQPGQAMARMSAVEATRMFGYMG